MKSDTDPVLLFKDVCSNEVSNLLSRYGLTLKSIDDKDFPIPGSFWGDEEAGLIENQVYVRLDTPVHSILHESCHYVCMDDKRRTELHTNAGGTADEENAVCYLQILLVDQLSFMNRLKMMNDMDSWGYSFRLGSAKIWFESDADDAYQWLTSYSLINKDSSVTFHLRS